MTIVTKGMGAIIKNLAKAKAAKKTKEIVKRKSSEYIKSLGESKKRMYKDLGLTKKAEDLAKKPLTRDTLKDKKRTASPAMVDHYHKVMTSDFEKKTGPFFKDPKHGGKGPGKK